MIARSTLALVLLISSAHALLHIYELALPAVEQQIAGEFFPDDAERGKEMSGWLVFSWRMPLGWGAVLAGWLIDRWGARRMLALYLVGCGLCAVAAGFPLPLVGLFAVMFLMGSFAAIYHPAGLALISHETTPENRSHALGIHGIFGSLGVGLAPFLAGAVLSVAPDWRWVYLVLAVPGLALGGFFWLQSRRQADHLGRPRAGAGSAAQDDETSAWGSYFLLTAVAVMMGFIYNGVFAFLPRYLGESQWTVAGIPPEAMRNFLAGGVLLVGCFGQYFSGWIARPRWLERQLALVMLANAPLLVWMAHAPGTMRVAAAAAFVLVHFMLQPVYNSLIAKYTARRHRSVGYGLSFTLNFGLGATGAAFAGMMPSFTLTYDILALVAGVGGGLALALWWRHRAA